jgi:hypothetical protein
VTAEDVDQVDHVDPVSDRSDRVVRESYMTGLLETDAESWSRMAGLLAMLALPSLRDSDGTYRKQLIEIEILPGQWRAIDGVTIEAHRTVFHFGRNGSSVQYEFTSASVPRWRTPR